MERWRSGRIKEKRVLRIETKRALLLGTLIFIVAEVCARFLQSHTLSTLASPSFTIPATSLETTIFPRPSKTLSLFLISRNETSNFFRPLHLLSLSVPAETADKMASRDVSFVSFVLVSPPHRLQNLFTSSFGLLAPFTATAGKPRNKSRHRFFPPSNDSLRR